jgi:hypothetical protein
MKRYAIALATLTVEEPLFFTLPGVHIQNLGAAGQ